MKALLLITAAAAPGLLFNTGTDHEDTKSCSSVAQSHAAKNIVETAVAAGDFNTLAAALKQAELIEALSGEGPFTVFAPTDAAFAKLGDKAIGDLLKPENKDTLTQILTYHVVSGKVPASTAVKLDFAGMLNSQRADIMVGEDGARIAGANIVKTDIECSNGIIHVIDAVMLPNTKDIVGTAASSDAFETLVAAVKAAGLVEALQGEGPFTVFAPTNEAFAKLPEGTVESLLKPENKHKLEAILKHHVVSGRVYGNQAAEAGTAKTLNGTAVHFSTDGHELMVGDAKVVKGDLDTTNGVIHVIDTVLLP